MGKTIKSYAVFTSIGYRILALVVIPIVSLLISALLLASGEYEFNGIYPEMLLVSYVVLFEILSDFWLFGGICSKEGHQLDYFKTSRAGLGVLERGIIGDLIRRFLYLAVYGAFCYMFTGQITDFLLVLVAYVVTVALLNLTRYIQMFHIYMAVSMTVSLLVYIVLTVVCWFFADAFGSGSLYAEFVIFGVLAILVSLLSVWHIGCRMKGSYYEK